MNYPIFYKKMLKSFSTLFLLHFKKKTQQKCNLTFIFLVNSIFSFPGNAVVNRQLSTTSALGHRSPKVAPFHFLVCSQRARRLPRGGQQGGYPRLVQAEVGSKRESARVDGEGHRRVRLTLATLIRDQAAPFECKVSTKRTSSSRWSLYEPLNLCVIFQLICGLKGERGHAGRGYDVSYGVKGNYLVCQQRCP